MPYNKISYIAQEFKKLKQENGEEWLKQNIKEFSTAVLPLEMYEVLNWVAETHQE